jgi:hypothetical protein
MVYGYGREIISQQNIHPYQIKENPTIEMKIHFTWLLGLML